MTDMTVRKQRPSILISNDDGVFARGLDELVTALKDIGDIVVVAPDGPRSGTSSAITTSVPIHYTCVSTVPGITIYSCSGTPADCVKLALNAILPEKPDLVVAGINHGGNQSICVNYSGTLGAAIEGTIFDIPSLAISLIDGSQDSDFLHACRYARAVVRRMIKEGLPKGTYLNLNVPDIPIVRGIRVCAQADGKFYDEFVKASTPSGKEVFWMSGSLQSHEPDNKESDMFMIEKGFATLVPSKIDVTDYDAIREIKHWEQE